MKRSYLSCAFLALAMSVLLSLAGCSSPSSQGLDSKVGAEATKQVSVQIGTTNEVTLDIPETWSVDTSNNYATITPDDFDGIIQLGVNLSPMSVLTSDEELLADWQETDTTVTGEWKKISDEDDVAPMYESPAKMEGGKNAKGVVRVAISGNDAISVSAYAAGADWEGAEDEIKEVVDTFKVTDPQAPNYADSASDYEAAPVETPESAQGSPTPDDASNLGYTPSLSQQNALSSARSYLNYTAFSHAGLIDQLEFEGYSTEDATWAADNCGADWNAQALSSARKYLDYSSFSYTGLIDQLEFEGYTTEQATYGVDNCGADWNEQAAKSAQKYLDYTSFSRDGLIDQLQFEGFTHDQAVYGVNAVGL